MIRFDPETHAHLLISASDYQEIIWGLIFMVPSYNLNPGSANLTIENYVTLLTFVPFGPILNSIYLIISSVSGELYHNAQSGSRSPLSSITTRPDWPESYQLIEVEGHINALISSPWLQIMASTGLLLTEPLESYRNEIVIHIKTYLFKNIYLYMSSSNGRQSCLGLNMLILFNGTSQVSLLGLLDLFGWNISFFIKSLLIDSF